MSGTRYPVRVASRARELRESGWSVRQIRDLLGREENVRPALTAIARWTDPKYAERSRERQARWLREKRAEAGYSFAVNGNSPEYQAAFIRRLRDEDIAISAIAKVCRVVFDDSSWTYGKVRYALEGR